LELKSELPGILNLALQGLKRLQDLSFILPKPYSSSAVEDKMEASMKSSFEFFQENYEATKIEDDFIPTDTLYDQYVKWCEHVGAQRCRRQTFLADITRRYLQDGVLKKLKRFGLEDRRYVFVGLKAKTGVGSWVEQYYYRMSP
jgi:phage/plasmid-associated DNA primase